MVPSVIFSPSTDAAVIVEAVRHHGVALVRGALPAPFMVELGEVVARSWQPHGTEPARAD